MSPLLIGTAGSDGFLFAVGVTVAVVPCGLLPTVTLSLAIGAQRMAARHALVRHLEAVETLGLDHLHLHRQDRHPDPERDDGRRGVDARGSRRIDGSGYEPDAEVRCEPPEAIDALREVARVATRCSTGRVAEEDGRWVARGDPMEAALDALARRVGVDRDVDARHGDRDRPLPVRRPPATHVGRRRRTGAGEGRARLRSSRGASVPDGATEALQRLADAGSAGPGGGVVGSTRARPPAAISDEAESDLTLLGPRRARGPAAAGARPTPSRPAVGPGSASAMVTGDHPATALAIAREVGLLGRRRARRRRATTFPPTRRSSARWSTATAW